MTGHREERRGEAICAWTNPFQRKLLKDFERSVTSGRSRTLVTASTSVFFSSALSVIKSPSLK